MIDLSIIIVSWNVADLLAACLDSLDNDSLAFNQPEGDKPIAEIIIVDSGSTDNTVEMLQQQFTHVRVLAQEENVGFTRGNNIGLSAAHGRYVMLLNPDTEVIGDALPQMIHYLEQHPQTGIVGPHTLNSDGTHQSTRRRFPTLSTGIFESTWLQRFAPNTSLERYYVTDHENDETIAVDWVQGSALMARREVYEQIGGLDTGYVMYWEELDWCKRAKDKDWDVVYLGNAQIIHHGGKSTEQAHARSHIHFQESKLRYFRKYHGYHTAYLLRIFLIANYLWQLAIEGLKGLLGHKRELRRDRVHTYWQVLRSGLKVT